MGLLDRDGTRGIDTSRQINPARDPIAPRGGERGVTDSPLQNDANYVVEPRYIAPVRTPIEPRSQGRTLSADTAAQPQGTNPPPDTPFGTAFSNFLGGGGGGDYQPIRVIPGDTTNSNNGLLIVLGVIGAAGAIWYFIKHRKHND